MWYPVLKTSHGKKRCRVGAAGVTRGGRKEVKEEGPTRDAEINFRSSSGAWVEHGEMFIGSRRAVLPVPGLCQIWWPSRSQPRLQGYPRI